MAKQMGLSIVIGSAVEKARKGIKEVTTSLTAIGSTVDRLNQKKLDIISENKNVSSFQKKINAIDDDLRNLQNKRSKLTLELSTAKSEKEAKQLREQIGDIDNSVADLNSKRFDLESDLRDARDEAEKTDRSVASIGKTIESINRKKIDIDSNREKMDRYKSSIAGVIGASATLFGVTKSASETMKAQGEVATLGISTEGIDRITKAAHKMGMEFGQVTAPEFLRASYDIKSGISSLSEEGVAKFTKMAATTATATKATTSEMTNLYALGYGIFREDFGSDMEFGEKFSGAISHAVQAFKTDGGDLSQGISNIGAQAKAMGVSLEEELAIIGNAKSAFNSASEAGTAYRAFLSGAVKAQDKLGMKFVDSEGKMLPMVQILEKIKNKYGDLNAVEVNDISKAFGGDEAGKMITALVNKTDELKKSQDDLNKAMDGGTAKAEEMAKKAQQGQGFARLGNSLNYLGYTIGKTLYPAVESLGSGMGWLAEKVAWLNETFPVATKVIAGTAGGALALTAVVPVLGYGFYFLKNGLDHLRLGLTMAKGAMQLLNGGKLVAVARSKALAIWEGILAAKTKAVALWSGRAAVGQKLFNAATAMGSVVQKGYAASLAIGKTALVAFSGGLKLVGTAITWVGRALMANPIGIVVGAIAGAAYLLYEYWGPVKEWFGSLWGGIKSIFSTALEGIKTVFSYSPLGLVVKAWGAVFDWFKEKFDWFGSAIDKVKEIGSGIASALGFGDGDEKQKEDKKPKAVNRIKKGTAAVATATTLAASPAQIQQQAQEQPKIQQSRQAAINPSVRAAVVDPRVNQPEVKPKVRQPGEVIPRVRQPDTISPRVGSAVVDPQVNQPDPIEPEVRAAVVDPKVKQAEVKQSRLPQAPSQPKRTINNTYNYEISINAGSGDPDAIAAAVREQLEQLENDRTDFSDEEI